MNGSVQTAAEKENLNGTINTNYELEMGAQVSEKDATNLNERARWGHSMEFLMSCIAMSVGLGNLWRFPFVAFSNGGGAFLIPYLITLFIIGRPMYLLDMFMGQFSGHANVHSFSRLTPASVGVAFGQLYAVWHIATYYCSVMAISLRYVVSSMSSVLPWTVCSTEWDDCVGIESNTSTSTGNISKTSEELYFKRTVLHAKSTIEDGVGAPDWQLTLYLLAAWSFIFGMVIRGVRSSGKASYFLALFPYVVLLTLFIKGLTLEGAFKGIWYFFEPKWEKMFEPNVWFQAVTQCFFSLNVAVGPVIMYSSYNKFKHDIKRDSLIISLMDTMTSLLAGCTVFSILGNLAFVLGKDVKDVVEGGPGLVFISYPKAIANFESAPQVFACLFFAMLFVLGTGSIVSIQCCLATVLKDEYPRLKDWWLAAGICFLGFIMGLVYVTPGGQQILTLVDHYAATSIIYIMAIAEVVTVTWFYGLENVCLDLEFMLKQKVNIYWRLCWGLITPSLLISILFYYLYSLETLKYENIDYPTSITAIGWLLFAFGVLQIPGWAAWSILKRRRLGLKEAVAQTFSFENWGPKDPNVRKEWELYKMQAKMSRGEGFKAYIMYLLNVMTTKNELI